jgi:hypothetical protein
MMQQQAGPGGGGAGDGCAVVLRRRPLNCVHEPCSTHCWPPGY